MPPSSSGVRTAPQKNSLQANGPPDHYHINGLASSVSEAQAMALAEEEAHNEYSHRSLLLFRREHPLRILAIRVVEGVWFDRLILLLIVANCFSIAISGPQRTTPADTGLELFFTTAFTAELGVRVLATGLVQGRRSYLRDRWHWLDLVVVITSWVSIGVASTSTNYGALRTFRVLRPLRTVTRVRGMRVLVMSMLRSIPKLMDVTIVAGFVGLVFAIIGVQLFKGALHSRCVPENDPVLNSRLPLNNSLALSGSDYDESVCSPYPPEPEGTCNGESGFDCVYFETNPNYGLTSFDDVPHALLSIFVSVTLEGWSDVMYMTSRGASAPLAIIYFVALVLIGAFFVINLFLAVIFESFLEAVEQDKEEQKEEKEAEEEKERREAEAEALADGGGALAAVGSASTARAVVGAGAAAGAAGAAAGAAGAGSVASRSNSCAASKSALTRSVSAASANSSDEDVTSDLKDTPSHLGGWRVPMLLPVVESSRFLNFFSAAILVNTVMMALDGYGIPTEMDVALENGNIAFTAIFTIEVGLKLAAYGPLAALRVPWTAADFAIVLLSWVELALAESSQAGVGFQLTVFRTFRLLRMVKLARSLPGLQRVMRMINKSLEQIVYLVMFFVLILFIAALLGQELFHGRFAPTDGTQFNFNSFSWAVITIFVVLSGENWNEIMYSGAGSVPVGMRWQVVSYFIVVVVVGRFFVLNLFIAVLLSNISEVKDEKAAAERRRKMHYMGKMLLVQQLTNASTMGAGTKIHVFSKQLLTEHEMQIEQAEEPPVWERDGGLKAISFGDTEAMMQDAQRAREAALAALDYQANGQLLPPTSGLHSPARPGAGGLRGLLAPRAGIALWRQQHSSESLYSVAASEREGPGGAGKRAPLRPRGVLRSRSADDFGAIAGGGGVRSGKVGFAADVAGNGTTSYAHKLGWGSGARAAATAPPAACAAVSATPAVAKSSSAGARVSAPPDVSRSASAPVRTASKGGAVPAGGGGWFGALVPQWMQPAPPPPPVAERPRRPRSLSEQRMLSGGSGGSCRSGLGGNSASLDPVLLKRRRSASKASHKPDTALVSTSSTLASRTSDPRGAWAAAKAQADSKTRRSHAPHVHARKKARKLWDKYKNGKDLAFGCLSRSHPVRAGALAVVDNPFFERTVIALICVSSLVLAIDSPGLEGQWIVDARPGLAVLEWIFTVLFLCEMLLKITAHGLLRTSPAAYFRSTWNWLDFALVVTSVTARVADVAASLSEGNTLFDTGALSVLRTLRLLRVLRPLRVLVHNEGLQLVVNSLLRSFPEVMNVLLIFLLFLAVFAILGMQLFAGKLSSCSDPTIETKERCVGTYVDSSGVERERGWFNDPLGSFDHFGVAAMLLFEMANSEMWPDAMLLGMGARGVDIAPDQDVRDAPAAQTALSIFFIAWITVGAFFVINLFVGVVIDNFNELKDAQDGFGLLTEGQKAWSDSLRVIASLRARRLATPPRQEWRAHFFLLVSSQGFEVIMMLLVLSNVTFMAVDQFPGSAELTRTLNVANYTFTALFTAELIVKVIGFGVRGYSRDRWNLFDALLVVMSWLDLMLELLASVAGEGAGFGGFSPMIFRTLRIFRIMRMLRLVRSMRSIRNLVATLLYALPALANVGGLLLLVLFVYSALGAQLFFNVARRPDGFLNADANFDNFLMSALLLFRAMTGESWNGLMHDCMVQEDERGLCSEAEGTCSPHPFVAILFFFSFVIISVICLNLVIAVILEKKSAMSNENMLTKQELDHFQEVWSDFDRKGSYTIPTVHVAELLWNLDAPLGLGQKQVMARVDVLRFLDDLNLPEHNGLVHMHEVLLALARNAHGIDVDESRRQKRRVNLELPKSIFTTDLNRLVENTLRARGLTKLAPARLSAAQIFAVQLLQRRWRQARTKRIFSKLTEETGRQARRRGLNLFGRHFSNGSEQRERSLRDLVGEEGPRVLLGLQRAAAPKGEPQPALAKEATAGSGRPRPGLSSLRTRSWLGHAAGEQNMPPLVPPSSRMGLIAKVRGADGVVSSAEWISAETLALAEDRLRAAKSFSEGRGGVTRSFSSKALRLRAVMTRRRLSQYLGISTQHADDGAAADEGAAGGAKRDDAAGKAEHKRGVQDIVGEAGKQELAETLAIAIEINAERRRAAEESAAIAAAEAQGLAPACVGAAPPAILHSNSRPKRSKGLTVSETFPQAVTPEYYKRSDVRLARGVRSIRRAYGTAVVQRIDQQQRKTASRLMRWFGSLGFSRWTREAEGKAEQEVVVTSADMEDGHEPTQREKYLASQRSREPPAPAGWWPLGGGRSLLPWASAPAPAPAPATRLPVRAGTSERGVAAAARPPEQAGWFAGWFGGSTQAQPAGAADPRAEVAETKRSQLDEVRRPPTPARRAHGESAEHV